jgi:hypothetical protein
VERELDRLERAPRPDEHGEQSAWLGWALAHCAQGIEMSLDGFPRSWPWLLKVTVGQLVKGRFLRQGFMKHDLSAPVPGAPAIEETDVTAALARLRRAIAAFRQHQGPLHPHPVYGACTRQEFERLHAMHIANHLQG